MLDKLRQLDQRYSAMQAKLSAPETYEDPALVSRLNRELAELEEVVHTYRAWQRASEDVEAAKAMLSEPDPELRELAKEELGLVPDVFDEETLARLEQELKILLLPKDPKDDRPVIVEIRAGVGGEEAALFAHSLYRMYTMYSDRRRWQTQIASVSETELGGVKELIFTIESPGAYSRMKFESGVHRVQRVPETESGGRVHTSTATVAVLPEIGEVDFKLDPNDLKIDTYRSSGAGGQHVNKTESAIRITHLPSGVVVECQDERSQYKNKDRAMQILRSKLYEMEQAKQNAAVAAQRKSQIGSGDRSERVRTYNFPQNRVTDHRLGGDNKNFNIDRIINGDLDELIDALITADQAEKLAENSEFGVRNSEL